MQRARQRPLRSGAPTARPRLALAAKPGQPRDDSGASVAATVDAADDRLFLDRARLGLRLVLAGILVVFVGWLFIARGQPMLLSLCHAVNFAAVLIALRLLRDPARPLYNRAVGFAAYALTVVLSGFEGIVANDSATATFILLGMAVIAAALIPWSPWWQLAGVAVTVVTAVWTVASVPSPPLYWLQHVGALLPTLAATVFLTHVLGRQRADAERAELERRGREHSLREANRRLEWEIDEHRQTEAELRQANRERERELEEHRKTELALRFAMRELDHRVKNTLALIQSVADQTLRSVPDLAEFGPAFAGRIQAMARIHGALAQRRWEGLTLTELVELVVGPYRHHADSVAIACDGSFVGSELVRVLGMALHELATNAAKYGALSTAQGRVSITSRRDADARLHIAWHEHGGPTVPPPERRGFGMRLIEEALAYEVDGRVAMRFPNDGLRCDIALPVPPPS